MPDPKTTAAPKKTRKLPLKWNHAELGALVGDFHAHGLEGVEKRADPLKGDRYGLHDAESAKAKLIELGLVAKPEKPVLEAEGKAIADNAVAAINAIDEPQRTLMVRYMLAQLRELLPKREQKKDGAA
jgi:hypothetical protein